MAGKGEAPAASVEGKYPPGTWTVEQFCRENRERHLATTGERRRGRYTAEERANAERQAINMAIHQSVEAGEDSALTRERIEYARRRGVLDPEFAHPERWDGPLHAAARGRRLEHIGILMASGYSPLWMPPRAHARAALFCQLDEGAALRGAEETLAMLRNMSPADLQRVMSDETCTGITQRSLMSLAVQRGAFAVVDYLLDRGHSVTDLLRGRVDSPLFWAARQCSDESGRRVLLRFLSMIEPGLLHADRLYETEFLAEVVRGGGRFEDVRMLVERYRLSVKELGMLRTTVLGAAFERLAQDTRMADAGDAAATEEKWRIFDYVAQQWPEALWHQDLRSFGQRSTILGQFLRSGPMEWCRRILRSGLAPAERLRKPDDGTSPFLYRVLFGSHDFAYLLLEHNAVSEQDRGDALMLRMHLNKIRLAPAETMYLLPGYGLVLLDQPHDHSLVADMDVVREYMRRGCSINDDVTCAIPEIGSTFHAILATHAEQTDLIRELIDRWGADVNARPRGRHNSLGIVVHIYLVYTLYHPGYNAPIDTINLLLDRGAEISGGTAAHPYISSLGFCMQHMIRLRGDDIGQVDRRFLQTANLLLSRARPEHINEVAGPGSPCLLWLAAVHLVPLDLFREIARRTPVLFAPDRGSYHGIAANVAYSYRHILGRPTYKDLVPYYLILLRHCGDSQDAIRETFRIDPGHGVPQFAQHMLEFMKEYALRHFSKLAIQRGGNVDFFTRRPQIEDWHGLLMAMSRYAGAPPGRGVRAGGSEYVEQEYDRLQRGAADSVAEFELKELERLRISSPPRHASSSSSSSAPAAAAAAAAAGPSPRYGYLSSGVLADLERRERESSLLRVRVAALRVQAREARESGDRRREVTSRRQADELEQEADRLLSLNYEQLRQEAAERAAQAKAPRADASGKRGEPRARLETVEEDDDAAQTKAPRADASGKHGVARSRLEMLREDDEEDGGTMERRPLLRREDEEEEDDDGTEKYDDDGDDDGDPDSKRKRMGARAIRCR